MADFSDVPTVKSALLMGAAVSILLGLGSVPHCSGVGRVASTQQLHKLILLSPTGDHFYKRNKNLPPEEQMISALPDIKVLTINDDHDFMVIACDGIW